MNVQNLIRQHLAAIRALLVLTAITGIAYPLVVWLVAMLPGLDDKAQGSIVEVAGKPVGSTLIGQSFSDADGNPVSKYFQSRPSAAGDGYDPLATSASNLGPESLVDTPADPALPKDANGYRASLLTLVCSRSAAVAKGGRSQRKPSVLHRRRGRRGALGHRAARRPWQRRGTHPGGQCQRTVHGGGDALPGHLRRRTGRVREDSARTTRSARSSPFMVRPWVTRPYPPTR